MIALGFSSARKMMSSISSSKFPPKFRLIFYRFWIPNVDNSKVHLAKTKSALRLNSSASSAQVTMLMNAPLAVSNTVQPSNGRASTSPIHSRFKPAFSSQ